MHYTFLVTKVSTPRIAGSLPASCSAGRQSLEIIVACLELAVRADVAGAVAFELDVLLLLAGGDFELALVGISDAVASADPGVQRWAARRANTLSLVLSMDEAINQSINQSIN